MKPASPVRGSGLGGIGTNRPLLRLLRPPHPRHGMVYEVGQPSPSEQVVNDQRVVRPAGRQMAELPEYYARQQPACEQSEDEDQVASLPGPVPQLLQVLAG